MSGLGLFFHPGQEITGRWDGSRYNVVRELGTGGTAKVLLVKNADGESRAMKISRDLPGITREHRTLLFMNNNRDIKNLGIVPGVYELDDYCKNGLTYHYIIMDCCPGRSLQEYKGILQPEELVTVGLMLAIFLFHLHQAGYVFGDLKPGNILYDRTARKISVVDFGSVCPKGRIIQQYTPLYDRSSWQAGSRQGDEKYDLFALSMLLLSLHHGLGVHIKKRSITKLLWELRPLAARCRIIQVVIRGLRQEYGLLNEIAVDLWRCRGKIEQQVSSGGGYMPLAVNLAGAISAFFFIMSLFYYYQ
ncbi:MAG: protein kinase domain-containing protein [Bacillota bacterium]